MGFSEPLDNSPPLSLSTLSSSGSFSLSTSGSLQTHLSSFNSAQRLRNLPSVAEDLEKLAEPDSDCSDDDVNGDDNRKTAIKQRFLWLAKAFVWFSVLYFPISLLGNNGFFPRRLSPRPSAGGYESGLRDFRKG